MIICGDWPLVWACAPTLIGGVLGERLVDATLKEEHVGQEPRCIHLNHSVDMDMLERERSNSCWIHAKFSSSGHITELALGLQLRGERAVTAFPTRQTKRGPHGPATLGGYSAGRPPRSVRAIRRDDDSKLTSGTGNEGAQLGRRQAAEMSVYCKKIHFPLRPAVLRPLSNQTRDRSLAPRRRDRSTSPYRDRRRQWSPYHRDHCRDVERAWARDRPQPARGGGGRGGCAWSGSDSDDAELKGLPYFEYRRLKRQKHRKCLKRCIWNITPNPLRRRREGDDEDYRCSDDEEEEKMESPKKASSSDKREAESKGSSESESTESDSLSDSSESDDSRSKKRGHKGSCRSSKHGRNRHRRRLSDSKVDEDSEGSYESEDSRERKSKRSRRHNPKRRGSSFRSKKRKSHDTEESSEEVSADSSPSPSEKKNQSSRTNKSKLSDLEDLVPSDILMLTLM
ncbi:hypothetical protein GUJ93_ZPchr0002g26255 [Zizania palustris]|uniref:Uncharacterized protein n=1 Tax=Zizania palustris TaxID=103762 RepID=A0A8J5RT50_ZIZPA|nr:hypothetical protein GUJ93_ZPchr0002g26255 [Zizania palustris]